MTEFEKVLQECLRDLELGDSKLDECLSRYPRHASQLKPILLASQFLERGSEARLSDAFKARVRTRLIQQMHAHPQKRVRPGFMSIHRTTVLVRLAASFAALVLALLVTGTVYAQNALPGDAFHAWKLASENAWRAVSPDPLGTDLAIAERRVDELIAVRNDPALYSQAQKAYLEVRDRLRSEMDAGNEARILEVLDSQVEELIRSGIVLPQPDQDIPPQSDEPPPTPTASPLPTVTPLPILGTPQMNPTELPDIIPTVQVPAEIIPTIQAPPEIIATIEEILPSIP